MSHDVMITWSNRMCVLGPHFLVVSVCIIEVHCECILFMNGKSPFDLNGYVEIIIIKKGGEEEAYKLTCDNKANEANLVSFLNHKSNSIFGS